MRSSETTLIPTVVNIYSCDSCSFVYRSDQPKDRWMFPIQICTFCNSDVCKHCLTIYDEDDNPQDWFSPDALACPRCKQKADKVWAVAQQIAGRHELMVEVVNKVFTNWNTYQHWFNDYTFEEDPT